jgi:hypothetical protein
MMVSQQSDATLTRAQRDAVHEHIGHVFAGEGDGLEFAVARGDRPRVRSAIWRLGVGVRMLDQLGWEEDGDRDSYRLELDDDIAAFMEELGRHGDAALQDDLRPGEPQSLIDIDRAMIDAARVVKAAIAGVA